MDRAAFEHVIRAAAAIVEDELVVIGSQSVLGQFPDAPGGLLRSMELDVYPRTNPSRAIEIDGSLGDGSPFHAVFDYYAHAVAPETATLPAGWEDRLIRVEVPATVPKDGVVVAWCLEVHDLVLSKLAAGREHDIGFGADAVRAGIANLEQLELGIDLMPAHVRDSTRVGLARISALATPRDESR
jgi:hypothetical protein